MVTQLMTTTTCRSGKGKGSQGRSPKKLKHPFRGADFSRGGPQLPLGRSCSCSGQPGCGKRWGSLPAEGRIEPWRLGGAVDLAGLAPFIWCSSFSKGKTPCRSHTHICIPCCRPTEEELQNIRPSACLVMSTSSRGLSVWRRLPDYRDGEQVRRRPEVESNCLGCKHVLTPRPSLLALLPVSQSTWLRPSARVPTPDRANGTYAFPLEDCSGSRLKLLVLRVPPSVWHRGSNLGLVSTSFGPTYGMEWDLRCWTPPGLDPSLPSALSMVWTTSIKAD